VSIQPDFTVTAEVEAIGLFEDENVNWRFCMEHATFTHKDACEFIIHCGDSEFVTNVIEGMKVFGCTKEFIAAYKLAADSGAVRVLFYA
jgi:hypothetical protein